MMVRLKQTTPCVGPCIVFRLLSTQGSRTACTAFWSHQVPVQDTGSGQGHARRGSRRAGLAPEPVAASPQFTTVHRVLLPWLWLFPFLFPPAGAQTQTLRVFGFCGSWQGCG